MPDWGLLRSSRGGKHVAERPFLKSPLFAMTRKKERMTPEIKRFLELLREEMEGL